MNENQIRVTEDMIQEWGPGLCPWCDSWFVAGDVIERVHVMESTDFELPLDRMIISMEALMVSFAVHGTCAEEMQDEGNMDRANAMVQALIERSKATDN